MLSRGAMILEEGGGVFLSEEGAFVGDVVEDVAKGGIDLQELFVDFVEFENAHRFKFLFYNTSHQL